LRQAVLALALIAGAGCTIVTPSSPDGGTRVIVLPVERPPPPPPLSASILYVINLQRSSTNLAQDYATMITGLASYMDGIGLSVDRVGVIATYADQFGPRLLLGRKKNSPAPSPSLAAALAAAGDGGVQDYQSLLPFLQAALGNISDGDLPVALQLLASSGNFEGDGVTSEAANVIGFGNGLAGEALPPELGGIDRRALFDQPGNLFIVVYMQPLPRRCMLGTAACAVDGSSPADILLATNATGGAAWLDFGDWTLPPQQIVHVSIATSEGEDLAAFRKRCQKDAVPLDAFDVIAPSPNNYFTPLMSLLNAAHPGTGHLADFCDMLGSMQAAAFQKLGDEVAAVATTR
jgi:hypothetical protein